MIGTGNVGGQLLVLQQAGSKFYLAYRCHACHRVITKLELLAWRSANAGKGRGNICPCGSGKISPTNPRGLEWLAPHVLKLRLAVFVSPPHETLLQRLLSPLLLWLGVPLISPPPPPPTQEEIDFANRAKLAIDERISALDAKLQDESIPLEEALVRHDDTEVAR